MGFVDESSQNINSNTQRLWSFAKLKIKKNTIHLKAKTIGCFMLNGIDTISFPIRTKSEDFCEFLVEVRHNNPVGRICLLADNFATHKAKRVREKANELNIILIYLPPYSPELNPIEYLWKSIKRIISISEIDTREELIKTAGLRQVQVPAYFPESLRWPPTEILAQSRPYQAVVMQFARASDGQTALVIAQAMSADFDPEIPLRLRTVREVVALDLAGHKAQLEAGSCEDGSVCSRIRWDEGEVRIVLTMQAPPVELIRIARSMRY